MSETRAEAPIPIFPLPNVVLFPSIAVPLFIFEARYRQMTRDALRGSKRIGMVAVDPRHAGELAGNPPVFDIGCEGEILRSEPRPDGTYHILLSGVRRFRIERELPPEGDRLYRCADLTQLGEIEPAHGDPTIASARSEVLDLMTRLAPQHAEGFRPGIFTDVDDVHFVNAFCQAVDLPTFEKQQLLEANGVRDRVRLLVSLLQFQAAERSSLDARTRNTMH